MPTAILFAWVVPIVIVFFQMVFTVTIWFEQKPDEAKLFNVVRSVYIIVYFAIIADLMYLMWYYNHPASGT